MVVLFLFGVSIFSYFMNEFFDILNSYAEFNKEIDDEERLNAFFDTLKHQYNGGKKLNKALITKMEDFFNFKWLNDPLASLKTSEDLSIFEQLPEIVQNTLLSNFLLSSFLSTFRSFFILRKNFKNVFANDSYKLKAYTWFDESYRTFMVTLIL